MIVKRSSEHGWLVIPRADYDAMLKHDYAGPEENGTVWVLSLDESGATCLFKGVQIEESS